MEEEHHHHHNKSQECETTVMAEETSVESKDRGLFDILGKKEEEKQQEEVIVTEFEKVHVSEPEAIRIEEERRRGEGKREGERYREKEERDTERKRREKESRERERLWAFGHTRATAMDDSNAVSVDMETIYLGGKVIFFSAALMSGFYDSMVSLLLEFFTMVFGQCFVWFRGKCWKT